MSSPLSSIRPLSVGIIGCGNIFSAYAKGCALFRALSLKSCADLNNELALSRAREFQIAAVSIPELLADPGIDIVINLTVPRVHAAVSMDILRAGKHVYSEKPLGVTVEEGRALLDLAVEKNLRVGCAPDTFLGAGYQTCRKLIDDGWLGRPLAGTAFMLAAGPESWHPNPAFFYQRGAGPMMDMGPYYITALVHLLGPIKSVCAVTAMARSERLATCKEHFGEMLPVEVPTHFSGTLLFQNGAVITISMSFDVVGHQHKPIEIYGAEGSLVAPDPNTFGGPVSVFRRGFEEWADIPLIYGYEENSRSIGVADMAHAIQSGRPHRCDGRLALHALEVMSAFEKSHEARGWVEIENQCLQPDAFPLGLPPQVLDA
ncbi:MAG: Gfo/Idh/MocA family oxidoreductase [Terrimicrobiaceae bacterium]|nr:Gfo/Idh/MocA family oxidoreductase [Terrimicrobiaceae bacterium]